MFEIKQRGSTLSREVAGGVTTFMAMSYIIFVQVGLLSQHAGMDPGGIIIATCLAAAAGSILMGLLANYPIALAPGMGENFFFAFTIIPAVLAFGLETPAWKIGMALVAISGVLFLLLSTVGFRSYVLNSIPTSLKAGITGGIGLLIATVGLWYGNMIDKNPGGLVQLVDFVHTGENGAWQVNHAALLTLLGLVVILALSAFKIRGAVLISILLNAGIALGLGMLIWPGRAVSLPQGFEQTAGGLFEGFGALGSVIFSHRLLELVVLLFVLLFMDLFDTVGTLVGVAGRAGLMKDGKLPHAERALAADAAGTIIGAGLGTTTVTSYVESATGVAVGARTGLAAIVTGLLMIVAIFFQPVIRMIGGGVEIAPGIFKYPLVAPAMIYVGAMMLYSLREVTWDDVTEYLPAFLAVLVMPLTMSISAGVAAGFVFYALGKLLTGRWRQCPLVVYIAAALFVVRYAVDALI
jgi:AGZA family xanthine/uracil permease-like MFS transporter